LYRFLPFCQQRQHGPANFTLKAHCCRFLAHDAHGTSIEAGSLIAVLLIDKMSYSFSVFW
jgi:hypothetical protein